jgi:hypothetical protein
MTKKIVSINLGLCILLTCCAQASPKTETVVPSTVSTANFELKTKIDCLKIVDNVKELESSDILILDSRRMGENNRFSDFDTYFIDMSLGDWEQVVKPGENLDSFSASPDYKWIAYRYSFLDENNNLEHNLVIADGNNQIHRTIPWEASWGPINWLNSQHLIIQINEPGKESEELSFLKLDPFTGEREDLKPDFPNLIDIFPLPNWDGWGVTAYDPMKTKFVSLQGEISGPYYYVLWDIERNEPITSIQVFGEFKAAPRWASDGEEFAFAPSLYSTAEDYPHYEILSVNNEGVVTQLTNLTDYYQWVYVADLIWSPDGRHIAFWFSYWEDKKPDFYSTETRYLAVVDTSNGLVVNYCIPGEKDAAIGVNRYPRPIWSPNGKQIVVQSQITDDSFKTILIDLQQEQAFQIAEDLTPVGWIGSP